MVRRKTHEEFIKECYDKWGDKILYDKIEYKNAVTKVLIGCKIEGHGYREALPGSILKGRGCPKCAGTERRTTEDFIKQAKYVHGENYTYESVVYINNHTKVSINCKKCGLFDQNPHNHLEGSGCPKCGVVIARKKRIKPQEKFIKQLVEVNGDKFLYDKVVYVNSKTKILIGCKVDGHGYYETLPCNMLKGHGCPRCVGRNKKTEEFIEEAKNAHGDTYDYSDSKYISACDKIKIRCRNHGIFEQEARIHLKGHGCAKCRNENNSERLKKSQEEFIEEAKKIHDEKYNYDQVVYKGDKIKVIIVCKIHLEFEQTPGSHLTGAGCPSCGQIQISNQLRKTLEEFIDEANEIHDSKYDYSLAEYINYSSKITIICPKNDHGPFYQVAGSHLQGHGCPKCINYKNETECIDIIQKLTNEPFVKSHPEFLRLSSKRVMELDGYNDKLKLALEYNGEQHYNYIPFFHRDGPDDLQKQIDKDNIKLKICQENGIYLIVVPYWVLDKQDFIQKEYGKYLSKSDYENSSIIG